MWDVCDKYVYENWSHSLQEWLWLLNEWLKLIMFQKI